MVSVNNKQCSKCGNELHAGPCRGGSTQQEQKEKTEAPQDRKTSIPTVTQNSTDKDRNWSPKTPFSTKIPKPRPNE